MPDTNSKALQHNIASLSAYKFDILKDQCIAEIILKHFKKKLIIWFQNSMS